jgi:16S rRNA (guanine527-N7)-methyltransferase
MTELSPLDSFPVLPELSELWQQTLDWQPDEAQQGQFQRVYEQILEGNRSLNLTRITEPQEFWEKHLWDSLVGVKRWLGDDSPNPFKVLDIGTGGGFPGVPVAIAFPHWSVTLLDSTQKKMVFLEGMLAALGIANAGTVVGRAEQLKRDAAHREQYDVALIRAVATTLNCAKYCLPLLKVGGVAVLYRGQWAEAEAIALESAAKKLGGEVEGVEAIATPLTGGVRHCVFLRKVAGIPQNLPLRRNV